MPPPFAVLALVATSIRPAMITEPVTLVLLPPTGVVTLVGPFEDAVSVTLAVDEVAFVPIAVCPLEHALAMHLAAGPLADKDAAARSYTTAVPVHIIVCEPALKDGTTRPDHNALSFAGVCAEDPLALVCATVLERHQRPPLELAIQICRLSLLKVK